MSPRSSGPELNGIYLARHGQTDDNLPPLRFQGWRDTLLNDQGKREAEKLALEAQGLGLKAIYTSQLARAGNTAAAVAAKSTNLEPIVDARLAEGDRGRWEGQLMETVERAEPELYAAWRRADADFTFPQGESLQAHQERAVAAIKQIAAGPLPALVITHGGTIRLLRLHLQQLPMPHFHELIVPNARLIPLAQLDG